MPIRKSVFGSRAERSNYQKLRTRWGHGYNIYHNLPFLQIVDVRPSTPLLDLRIPGVVGELWYANNLELSRLKKTSVDFTLCDLNDAPIVSIEFDGLQQGFNSGTRYRPERPLPPGDGGSWRNEITELKLRVAHGSLYPLIVVAFEQFRDVSSTTKLAIVDGVIGKILAARDLDKRLSDRVFRAEYIGMTTEEFDKFDEESRDLFVEDWFFGLDIESEMANNPLAREINRLSRITGAWKSASKWVWKPSVERAQSAQERIYLINNAILHGATVDVNAGDLGTISKTVWIPNFDSPGFFGQHIAEEFAELCALDEIYQRQRAHGKQSSSG